jgi:hypothetical protein
MRAKDQVEELDRVLQRQQALVMQVGRVVFDAAQRKGFDRPVPDHHHAVYHHRLEEALGLEVVHQVVGVEGRLMAARALALADEDLLAPHLCGRCLGGIVGGEAGDGVSRRVGDPDAILGVNDDVRDNRRRNMDALALEFS